MLVLVCGVILEVTSACLPYSAATQILCNGEYTSFVLFPIFRTNCCPHVVIISGKDNVHAAMKTRLQEGLRPVLH
jgi:hypothetical protein